MNVWRRPRLSPFLNGGKEFMMNYEIFKEVVKEKFMDYLPEECKAGKLEIREVRKVNKALDGLSVFGLGEGATVTPTVYVNDMYKEYCENEDIEETLAHTADLYVDAMKNAPLKSAKELNFEGASEQIVFQLVNTEQNKEMLSGMPHREYHDLSVIYRWHLGNDGRSSMSSMIDNNLAKKMNLTEEQLFKAAVENTKRIMKPTVKNMNEIFVSMCVKDGMPEEVAKMMIGDIEEEHPMWVISNENGVHGACSMLYEDLLHDLAVKIDSDLYILPSSIHETLAISTKYGDPHELADMVSEVNMSEVSLEERLSNQVYYYDKDLRKLSMATDTPNRRLDGIVAEDKQVYKNAR